MNAFQHGLAGAGDLVAPGEDGARVAARSRALASELGATGESGAILAHRASLLSIRMERLAERDFAAVQADVAEAKAQFDRDWADDLAGWVEALEGDDASSAIQSLEQTPDGLNLLQNAWKRIRDAIASDDYLARDINRAEVWLGLGVEEADDLDESDYVAKIDAELIRLRHLAESMTGFAWVMSQARAQAGILASFNPSPEAILARRYEAAAERGMYRAIRGIAEIRRARAQEMNSFGPEVAIPQPLPASVPTPLRPLDPPRPAPNPAPLGSFRAEFSAGVSPERKAILGLVEPAIFPETPRKKRPDLRKLAASRR